MRNVTTTAVCLIVLQSGLAFAGPEANQYCNDMYPADSYDAEDRSFYVNECLESYADEEQDSVEEDAYYDGTVEDFVETVPDDTQDTESLEE